MNNKFIRLPEVISITGMSRSSIYARINDGTFVKPVKLGPRLIGFVEAEVYEWVEKKIAESRQSE